MTKYIRPTSDELEQYISKNIGRILADLFAPIIADQIDREWDSYETIRTDLLDNIIRDKLKHILLKESL